MEQDYIETAFDNFLDTQKYDQAEEALFAITRAAFLAGWNAAKTSFTSERQPKKDTITAIPEAKQV